MAFDIEGAKTAGYSDAEIADHLAKQSNFDLAGAKKAGYNDAEILQHLSAAPAPRANVEAEPEGFFTKRAPEPTALLEAADALTQRTGLPFGGAARMLAGVPKAPNVAEALTNVPESGANLLVNVAKMAAQPITTAKELGTTALGGALNALPAPAAEAVKQVINKPEYVAHAIDMANQFGGAFKERYGSPEAFRSTFEKDPVGFAADLSLLMGGGSAVLRGVGATERGAALSAAGASVDPFASAANKMAAVASGGVNAMAKVPRMDVFTPFETQLLKATEGNPEAAAIALRKGNVERVPGSKPTAGEALVGGGYTGTVLPALEEQIGGKYAATAYSERQAAQQAAREKAVGTIAGTPSDVYEAKLARGKRADVNFETVKQAEVPADETFLKLMETPPMRDAISIAAESAATNQRPFQVGKNAPETMVPTSIVDPATGQPVMKAVPGEVATYTGKSLYDVKIALDEMIRQKSLKGTTLSDMQVRDIKGVRDKYLSWLEDKIPEVKTAREQFAKESKPINAMEVGQVLKDALISPLPGGTERATAFASSMRNAATTIKKATGETRFETLSQALETGDLLMASNVLEDIAQTAKAKSLAKEGRVQAGELSPASTLPRSPSYLSWWSTTANKILSTLEGRLDRRASIRLARAMLDPELLAKEIDKAQALKTPRKVERPTYKFDTTVPRTLNALAPANQNAMRPE